jgi:aryl carrier-like protein
MPDPRLGEEIAAAVVLRKGAHVPEQDLMQFAAGRLADFKVPRRIVILDEIPKGPTGKPQRIGLAKKLGLDQPAAPVSASTVSRPLTPGEAALAAIWCDVLKRPVVRAEDNFLESGGDSILAAQIIARIRGQMGKELAMISFFGSPTLAAMAQAVEVAPTAAAVENSQMQDLLASIESMSEEEAQNLLKP